MDDAQSRAYCERVLRGISTASWSRTSRCAVSAAVEPALVSGKFVLIGDALRTVHFSIGSEPLAFEDAIALIGRSRGGRGRAAALAAFERAQAIVRSCSPRLTRAPTGTSVSRKNARAPCGLRTIHDRSGA